MRERWKRHRAWLPVLVLVAAAALLFGFGRHHGLSDEVIGGLVGSLTGAAAILSGVLFDRQQRRADELEATEARRHKIKALIAAELVNVASGLIGAKDFMDSAAQATRSGSSAPTGDLLRHLPRPMPFTANLGVELLVLSQREIDVLATLRANLTISEASMRDEIDNRQEFGWLVCKRICNGIRHDIGVLAEAFSEFAPTRKLALGGKEPELASALLTRLSREDTL